MIFPFSYIILFSLILVLHGRAIQDQKSRDGIGNSGEIPEVTRTFRISNITGTRQGRILSIITGVVKVLPTLADSISVYQAATDSFSYVKRKFGSSVEDETADDSESPRSQRQGLQYPRSTINQVDTTPEGEETRVKETSEAGNKRVQEIYVQNMFFNVHYHKPGRYEIYVNQSS